MPRIVTAVHPRAAGSYGPEALEWARERFGMHPKRTTAHRWWQEFVMCLALQHDEAGALLWRTVLMGTARQSGKSWTLRELCMWRLEQAQRFGEIQTAVHTAAKLSQAESVWQPAAWWAKRDRPGEYLVRQSNGSARIGHRDGSAWIPQAANDQLGVSLSVGLALVDEAWDVPRYVVENGLEPTLAEAASPQLWLVSTAGRPRAGLMSDLYPSYRTQAIDELTEPKRTLILEWSAQPGDDPGDPATWRKASPHWDDRRAELLADKWAKAQRSPEALAAFWMQWLNVWPEAVVADARWLPARDTAATDGRVGDFPDDAACAIEVSLDGAVWAVAGAWPHGKGRVRARVHYVDSAASAAMLLGSRRVWVHAAVAKAPQLARRAPRAISTPEARAATSTLRTLVTDRRLTVAGVADDVWAGVRTVPADGGEVISGTRSACDVSGLKALSWACWAVESAQAQSGALVL